MLICFFTSHLKVVLRILLLPSLLLSWPIYVSTWNAISFLVCPANFYTFFKTQLSYHLWGPLMTSSGRIKYIILCALRAGTIFFCGTLHILLRVCIIVCTSSYYGTYYISTVIVIAIMIIGNYWELYLHARHCVKCLRYITSLNPHPFPLRCPDHTDEERQTLAQTHSYPVLESVLLTAAVLLVNPPVVKRRLGYTHLWVSSSWQGACHQVGTQWTPEEIKTKQNKIKTTFCCADVPRFIKLFPLGRCEYFRTHLSSLV